MIGIVGAMKEEIAALVEALENRKEKKIFALTFFVGKICGKKIAVVKSGIGKVNASLATTILIKQFKAKVIINLGVCGGLSNLLKQTDFVVGEATIQHDFDCSVEGLTYGHIPSFERREFYSDKELCEKMCIALKGLSCSYKRGVIVSGDQFISSTEKKDFLISEFNALGCDMESAAVAQVCFLAGVKFLAIRSVSDCADETAIVDFTAFCAEAASRSIKAVVKLIEIFTP